MRIRRSRQSALTVLLAGLLLGVVAAAQDDNDEDAAETEGEMDEIVVIVDRSGDPVMDMDVRQEAVLRERIMNEYFRLQQLEEDAAWRQADPDLDPSKTSRIKWGYNPQAEARMRRETDLMDLPIDEVKPATLFRVEF
jgi:hypothetical protein